MAQQQEHDTHEVTYSGIPTSILTFCFCHTGGEGETWNTTTAPLTRNTSLYRGEGEDKELPELEEWIFPSCKCRSRIYQVATSPELHRWSYRRSWQWELFRWWRPCLQQLSQRLLWSLNGPKRSGGVPSRSWNTAPQAQARSSSRTTSQNPETTWSRVLVRFGKLPWFLSFFPEKNRGSRKEFRKAFTSMKTLEPVYLLRKCSTAWAKAKNSRGSDKQKICWSL